MGSNAWVIGLRFSRVVCAYVFVHVCTGQQILYIRCVLSRNSHMCNTCRVYYLLPRHVAVVQSTGTYFISIK